MTTALPDLSSTLAHTECDRRRLDLQQPLKQHALVGNHFFDFPATDTDLDSFHHGSLLYQCSARYINCAFNYLYHRTVISAVVRRADPY